MACIYVKILLSVDLNAWFLQLQGGSPLVYSPRVTKRCYGSLMRRYLCVFSECMTMSNSWNPIYLMQHPTQPSRAGILPSTILCMFIYTQCQWTTSVTWILLLYTVFNFSWTYFITLYSHFHVQVYIIPYMKQCSLFEIPMYISFTLCDIVSLLPSFQWFVWTWVLFALYCVIITSIISVSVFLTCTYLCIAYNLFQKTSQWGKVSWNPSWLYSYISCIFVIHICI